MKAARQRVNRGLIARQSEFSRAPGRVLTRVTSRFVWRSGVSFPRN
jgi:hypothetical protein